MQAVSYVNLLSRLARNSLARHDVGNAHLAQDSGSLLQDHWNSLARWHFSITLETHSAVKQGLGHAWAALQTRYGLAGSLLSNPAVRTWVCQRNRNAVCSSTSGKLPTTRSSLRRQLPSQFPSQLRSLRSQCLRSLGNQPQRSLGSQRPLGSLRSLGTRRSLCRSRRIHGLRVPSREAFPCPPCRRRRTSPS